MELQEYMRADLDRTKILHKLTYYSHFVREGDGVALLLLGECPDCKGQLVASCERIKEDPGDKVLVGQARLKELDAWPPLESSSGECSFCK